MIRALEYYHQTGQKMSRHNEEERQKESPYEFVYFVLNAPREQLYQRIDRRVDQMMSEGLVEEVKRLKEMGCTKRDGFNAGIRIQRNTGISGRRVCS